MYFEDKWKFYIPNIKLEVYKQMIAEGLIRNPHVTFIRNLGMTIIGYESDYPHEWIKQEMAKRL